MAIDRTPAAVFRKKIETALDSGLNAEELTLHLTLRDAQKLKLDRTLAVADISFADGVMRFLGVKTVQGGVPESNLDWPGRDAARG